MQTDERFRGRSFSDGRPVGSLNLSYDDKSGAYLGGSATAILTGESRAGLMGVRAYGGFARRLDFGATLDLGVIGYQHTRRFSGNRAVEYYELYGGLSKEGLLGNVRVAPDYFDRGVPAVYVEIVGTKRFRRDWRLNSSAGLLVQTSGAPILGRRRERYDLKFGVSREFDKIDVHADLTFGGPDDDYYSGPFSGRSALVLSAARSF